LLFVVFVVIVVYFIINPVRKLLDSPSWSLMKSQKK